LEVQLQQVVIVNCELKRFFCRGDCGDFFEGVISGLALYIGCHSPPKNFGGNIDEIPPFFVGIYRKTGDPECAGECLLEPSLMSIVELVELL